MTLNKYAVGLLQVAIIAVTALQAAVALGWSLTAAFQLAGLIIGAIVSVFVPLLEGRWAAGLKVGGAVLGALIAAIIPFVTDGWSPGAIVIVVLAGLNALATQLGVDIRIDSAVQALGDPSVPNASVEAVDPAAVRIAYRLAA